MKATKSFRMPVMGSILPSYRRVSAMLGAAVLVVANTGHAAISLTGAGDAQNFDTLASSGTSSSMPLGWSFSESGNNANTTYTAGTGSGNTGDTFSFGSTGTSERALGGLQSGNLSPTFGVEYANGMGVTITSLTISYFGEQWRLGALSRLDRLDFQYSTDATSLTTGIWTDVDTLDFVAPVTTGSTGALDGNAVQNRQQITSSIMGLSIQAGSSFWLRWTDLNASGADDGLAVDDFTIAAIAVPEPSTFVAGALLVLPFGVQGIRWLRSRKRT
jgi:hypothetical protein